MRRYLYSVILFTIPFILAGQSPPFVFDVGEQDDLGDIVEKLEERNWHFAYAPDQLSLRPQRTGTVKSESIKDLFADLFGDLVELHLMDDNQILLRKQHKDTTGSNMIKISGRVGNVDQSPIADILIYDDNYRVETISNESGYFEIEISNDVKFICFQGLGYMQKKVPVEEIHQGQPVILSAVPLIFEPVLVVGRLPALDAANGAYTLHADRYSISSPAISISSSDIVRSFQLLPGVTAHDDLSAGLTIRGSENASTLMLLDGIPIYKADHFYGIFSNINGSYVNEATLYKNGLPVQYGGKTGGLLEMHSPQVSSSSLSGSAEINLLASSVFVNAPLSDQLSLLIAGRTSYLKNNSVGVFDYLDNRVQNYQEELSNITRREIFSVQPDFNYGDLNGRLIFRPSKQTSLDFNFFYSEDQFENGYNIDYLSRGPFQESSNREVFRSHESWNNLGASVNLAMQLSGKWKVEGNAYYSQHENQGGVESLLDRQVNNQLLSSSFNNFQDNSVADLGGIFSAVRTGESSTTRLGFSAKRQSVLFSLQEDQTDLVRRDQSAGEFSVFGSRKYQFDKWDVQIGSRINYYTGTEAIYFDPQFRLSYHSSEAWTWKMSYSYMHQYVREISFENRLGNATDYFIIADEEYPVSASSNIMLGWLFKKNEWTLDVELYNRNISGVLEFARPELGFKNSIGPPRDRLYRVFVGDGKVQGMDVLLQFAKRKYQGWLSYTLSKSTRSFNSIRRGIDFPSEDDRRHQLSLVNSYSLGKFDFSANYVFASGRPYLDLTQIGENNQRNGLDPDRWISRLPSYNRFDVGVHYKFNILGRQSKMGVSCFNLFDNQNVKYLQYVYSIPTQSRNAGPLNTIVGTETALLNRTFNLSFSVDF